MKSAIYVDEGRTQIVLTPETEFENETIRHLEIGITQIKRGGFYDCQGGWTRHSEGRDSLILVMAKEPSWTVAKEQA